jgi:hypothetical protein
MAVQALILAMAELPELFQLKCLDTINSNLSAMIQSIPDLARVLENHSTSTEIPN